MAEIQVAVFTDAGTRDHNEDACGYGAQDGRACFVVADGLGGHDKGEVASHAAVDYIMEHFQEMECCSEESLLVLLEGADQAVRERQEECPDMRTTVAAACGRYPVLLSEERLYLYKEQRSLDPAGRGQHGRNTDRGYPVP